MILLALILIRGFATNKMQMDELSYVEEIPYTSQLNLFEDAVEPPPAIAEAHKWNNQPLRISQAIDKISQLAEQLGVESIRETNPKRCENLDFPPRLSLQQSLKATSLFSYDLPVEFHMLLQRGNGCLPIGLNRDLDSFDNYFELDSLKHWLPKNALKDCSWGLKLKPEYLQNHDAWGDSESFNLQGEDYQTWIPLFKRNDSEGAYVILGSKPRRKISPIYSLFYDAGKLEMGWPSIADLIFSLTKLLEAKHI